MVERLTLDCFSSFDVGCGGLSDGRQRFSSGAKFDSGGLSKLLAKTGYARLPGFRSGRNGPTILGPCFQPDSCGQLGSAETSRVFYKYIRNSTRDIQEVRGTNRLFSSHGNVVWMREDSWVSDYYGLSPTDSLPPNPSWAAFFSWMIQRLTDLSKV